MKAIPKEIKSYKELPPNEIRWVEQTTLSGDKFFITSDKLRMKYTLWKKLKDGFQKITTGETPGGFHEYIEE